MSGNNYPAGVSAADFDDFHEPACEDNPNPTYEYGLRVCTCTDPEDAASEEGDRLYQERKEEGQ